MKHLIWSILNLTILFCFFYLIIGFIIKGKRVFKPTFKVFSICILVIGIIQILSASNSEKNTNIIKITEDYDNKNNTEFKKVILEDNLTLDIEMLVKYSINNIEYVPIESHSSLTGFVSGYVWEFESIYTESYIKGQKATYTANGVLKWNLFGFTIYNESKTISGIMN
ncbi:MAG: hypothetical protein WA775_14540 [Psychroserpens sp.]|uniref:hypothetical protein n=1 Tax=Psychroserpens sp. TaxID=2020870 RepID=UPI003CC0A98C